MCDGRRMVIRGFEQRPIATYVWSIVGIYEFVLLSLQISARFRFNVHYLDKPQEFAKSTKCVDRVEAKNISVRRSRQSTSSNQKSSPDESHIQISSVTAPIRSHRITSRELAYSSEHNTINYKHNQVQTVNNKLISVSSFHLFSANSNIYRQVLHDLISIKSKHVLSDHTYMSDSLL